MASFGASGKFDNIKIRLLHNELHKKYEPAGIIKKKRKLTIGSSLFHLT